jgi:hypothetical protein
MPGVDVAPMLRRLGQLSDFQLGLAYTGGILPAVFIREWAAGHPYLEWLRIGAAGWGLVTISVFIAVVAFYRDDDVLLTGILLAGITGIGTGVAFAVTVFLMTGSLGGDRPDGGRLLCGRPAPHPSGSDDGCCCLDCSKVPPLLGTGYSARGRRRAWRGSGLTRKCSRLCQVRIC